MAGATCQQFAQDDGAGCPGIVSAVCHRDEVSMRMEARITNDTGLRSDNL
jgi:hypothetical protein